MKYTNFMMKLLALVAIGGILYYYQTIAVARAALAAENEAAIAEVEAYNKEIEAENARRLAAAAGGTDADNTAGTEDGGESESQMYQDGTYEGEGTGYGGPIVVQVTIEQDQITEVEVLSHDGEDPAYYMLAEGLTDAVVEAQSAEIDAASGATFSSHGILEAVGNALKEAGNE